MDSGQESDPSEQTIDGGGARRGGLLKNFRKMFKIKRKSKVGKISGDLGVDARESKGAAAALGLRSQYKAVSEPEILASSKQNIPTENTDFTTSDDEERVSRIFIKDL